MTDARHFEVLLQERWPFLQGIEEELAGLRPVLCADLSQLDGKVTTPTSLQHVGEQIVETARSDWIAVEGLDTVVARLNELAELWELIFKRHQGATTVFAEAMQRPYCLFLRSFANVTHAIDVPGARATMYLNEPELDANFASMLMREADWLNPVSCMHTDDMQFLVGSELAMPAFRVLTVNWQGVLADAIASSGSLIFYVSGDTPGVEFEVERIREQGLESQTVIVHRGEQAPGFCAAADYAAVMPVARFIDRSGRRTGPGTLSQAARTVLLRLASVARTRRRATQRLLTLPCKVVDSWVPAGFDSVDPETSYIVTASNADAFVRYVEDFPDSFLRWNAISQDIRLRGIQPDLDRYNALYRSLRMAFVASACLGFAGSISGTAGLLAKVASMAKPNPAQNKAREERYMKVLDIALRFNALTRKQGWSQKIEAFRESIREDPFM